MKHTRHTLEVNAHTHYFIEEFIREWWVLRYEREFQTGTIKSIQKNHHNAGCAFINRDLSLFCVRLIVLHVSLSCCEVAENSADNFPLRDRQISQCKKSSGTTAYVTITMSTCIKTGTQSHDECLSVSEYEIKHMLECKMYLHLCFPIVI